MAYKGYSAIIHTRKDTVMKMCAGQEDENLAIVTNGVTNYRLNRTHTPLIIKDFSENGDMKFGLLTMQSAVMMGCEKPSDENWVVIRDEDGTYLEMCWLVCSTPTNREKEDNYVSHLVHVMEGMLDLVDGTARVELLGASVRAVHDRVAAVQLVGVVQVLQTLLGHLITRVGDPAVRLLQDGGAQVLVRVPPVRGAGRGAARAQNALVQTVQQLAVLVGLKVLTLVIGVHLCLLLQPRLDGGVLLVEVGHICESDEREMTYRESDP